MDANKIKRNIRVMHRNGMTLDQAIAALPTTVAVQGVETLKRLWAEVEAEAPKRKTPSYREGVEFIAMNDEPTNLCTEEGEPDYIGAMPSVVLLAMLFGKETHAVAMDIAAFRRKAVKNG